MKVTMVFQNNLFWGCENSREVRSVNAVIARRARRRGREFESRQGRTFQKLILSYCSWRLVLRGALIVSPYFVTVQLSIVYK